MPVRTVPVQAAQAALDGLPGIRLRCPFCGYQRIKSASQGRGAGPIERTWRCQNCQGTWTLARIPTRRTCQECQEAFWQRRTDQTQCTTRCRYRRSSRESARRKREARRVAKIARQATQAKKGAA